MTGHMCNMPLPPHLRALMFRSYSTMLGVDLSDLPEGRQLNDYRNFNEFFTREIDLSKRPIHLKANKHTMCSPVDGKVLSYGELNTKNNTIQCVKGADYPLAEFLFGFSN